MRTLLTAALLFVPLDVLAQNFVVDPMPGPSGDIAYYAPITIAFDVRDTTATFTGNVAYRVRLQAQAGGVQVLATGTVFLSNGGGSVLRTVPLPPSTSLGLYRLDATVDPMNAIPETNENDNSTVSANVFTVRGPDLVPEILTAPTQALVGETITVHSIFQNTTPWEARDFHYHYLVTDGAGTTVDAFASTPLTVLGGSALEVVDTFTIPANAPLGAVQLTLFADATAVVPESSETNNVTGWPIDIRMPAPDFTVALADIPSMLEAGQVVDLQRTIANLGTGPTSAGLTVYLSTDANITTQDRAMGTGLAILDGFASDTDRIEIVVPSDTASGDYFIGAIVDPANQVSELDEQNNTFSFGPVTVFESPLRIVTSTLPDALLGRNYSVEVSATGVSGAATWSIVSGSVPPGIVLTASGVLTGRAQRVGLAAFVVQVEDAVRTASAMLSILVEDDGAPLVIPEQRLPDAREGVPYAAAVTATGGRPPYVWRTTIPPPQGLQMTADGIIEGLPTAVGYFEFTVSVSDADGRRATGRIELDVEAGGSVRFVANPLPDGRVGDEYCGGGPVRLGARDGAPPYVFSIERGEVPGLMLAADGALCGVPERVGSFDFVARVVDAEGRSDTERFQVDVVGSVRVTSSALPDARLGAPYEHTLEATGGVEPYTWSIAGGDLPVGLTLSAEGVVAGVPTVADVWSLAIEVRDAVGATHVAPISLRVVQTDRLLEEAEAVGCACTGERPGPVGGTSSWWLVLLPLLRRRTR